MKYGDLPLRADFAQTPGYYRSNADVRRTDAAAVWAYQRLLGDRNQALPSGAILCDPRFAFATSTNSTSQRVVDLRCRQTTIGVGN
jgi:hypothetical protein